METPTNKPKATPLPPASDAKYEAFIVELIDLIRLFKLKYRGGWNKKLAELAGTSAPNISALIKFKKPKLKTLFRIANAIGSDIKLQRQQTQPN